MDPLTIATGAAAAVNYGKAAYGAISDLNAAVQQVLEKNINSLTEYTKQTLISSRVYIEDTISSEPVIGDFMKFLQKMYAGLILSTIQIGSLVEGGKTVRQLVAPVSTENLESVVSLIEDTFGKENVAIENKGEDKGVISEGDLFSGSVLKVTLGRGDNSATINLVIQLKPYIIPSLVMEEFLRVNTDIPDAIRKAQLKAGEIKFWKDYIFECDKVARRKKALRLDKDGILHEMEDHKTHGFWESIKNWFRPANVTKHNVANSIIIVSKQRLDKICKETGINMRNFKDRQNVFGNTMSMIMIVYDPNYETVDMYMNGISNRGEYTVSMIKNATKKESESDLKQLITLLAAGTAPKAF